MSEPDGLTAALGSFTNGSPLFRQSLMSPAISIRPLDPSDAQAFQRLRLEGLENSPEAFASSYEEEVSLPIETVSARIPSSGPNVIFGAFDEGRLVGVAGFAVHDRMKARHKGVMWGVYVKPEWRGHSTRLPPAGTVVPAGWVRVFCVDPLR